MKVAVLGANGMLGARVVEELEVDNNVVGYVRAPEFDLKVKWDVRRLCQEGFDWIVNCAGIVKSRERSNPLEMVLVNSAMPHWIEDEGARVIHISTDCVFSGTIGSYETASDPDPVDLYGASKVAGELRGPRSITIRTSFIGWEYGTERGLLEWFVRQKKVEGYRRALWSGLSAREVARAVKRVLECSEPYVNSGGTLGQLYHLSGDVISKHDLLCELKAALGLDVEIEDVPGPDIDRTLINSAFNATFGYKPPTWIKMAEELARERPHA